MGCISVGIPRALLYYDYHPFWATFIKELGAEIVLSPTTTRHTINSGLGKALDDVCLPVKVYYGHAMWLLEQGVDILFAPRMVSVEPRAYTCPKLMGLPDMIRSNLSPRAGVIDSCVDMSKSRRQLAAALVNVAIPLSKNPLRIRVAYNRARAVQHRFENLLRRGLWPEEAMAHLGVPGFEGHREDNPGADRASKDKASKDRAPDDMRPSLGTPDRDSATDLTVGLLGHSYNLYDGELNLRLASKLRNMGVSLVTAEALDNQVVEACNQSLPKPLFWTSAKRLMAAALTWSRGDERGTVDGIVHVVSFGCGPDSLVGELAARWVRRDSNLPFLLLTLDEHSGEAGLVTRLEAFVDMLRWRRIGPDSNGEPGGCTP